MGNGTCEHHGEVQDCLHEINVRLTEGAGNFRQLFERMDKQDALLQNLGRLWGEKLVALGDKVVGIEKDCLLLRASQDYHSAAIAQKADRSDIELIRADIRALTDAVNSKADKTEADNTKETAKETRNWIIGGVVFILTNIGIAVIPKLL